MANKKVFIALLVGLGLIFVIGRPYVVSVNNGQQLQEVASSESASSSNSEPLQSLVAELDFYRQLSIGDSFTLQLGANNADAITEVVVTQIALDGVVASIVGSLSLPANGSILMTVGDKFMNIFLTLDNGIYEFSGRNFQGVVERTKDMRFENDTAIPRNQSVELSDTPVRRAVELPVTSK